PRDAEKRAICEALFEAIIREEGQRFLGWRTVPIDDSQCGVIARESMPSIRQIFIGRGEHAADQEAFERKLYVIRKRVIHTLAERGSGTERARGATESARRGQDSESASCVQGKVAKLKLDQGDLFYVCSLSSSTIVYKGQLISHQIPRFYPDLVDPAVRTALAMVHQRFSTNTFPSWDRAHPYRFLSHNGEINTLRGNINWMHAREKQFASELFGEDIKKLLPIIEENGSDSAVFDNCLELLVRTGRSLPHAALMMIPEAWQNDQLMDPAKKAFYEFHSCMMEPWDGPASITFTDGRRIGAVLDRNGLRPSRYLVTKDGLVVMASEAGVLDIP